MSTELTGAHEESKPSRATWPMDELTPAPKERLAGLSLTCSPHRIANLHELMYLASTKSAVVGYIEWLHKPMPAAWVVSMQARMVHQALCAGIYLYEPKRPRRGGDLVR